MTAPAKVTRTPLSIALYALREIVDIEKSANVGWNGLQNAVGCAKRALQAIENQEQVEIDRAIDNDIDHQEHGMEGL